jgi:quinol monooxygenase YgiN
MRTTSPRFEDSDVAFHYAIATIPRIPSMWSYAGAIIDWLVDQRRVTLSYPGQNRVAFDSHVAIFEAIKAHDPELAAPACARTWIRLASSTGRSGGRASERFMVTVEFKPKPTAVAAFRTLIDENAQISREREPRHVACASPCSYPWADDCILLWEIYDSRAAFSLAAAALRRVRQDQRRLVMNNSVTGLDLNFEGSNNRR